MITPTKYHWPHLLHMCGNVFSGLQLVRIIEGLDKRGLDNRGCTVYYCTCTCTWPIQFSHYLWYEAALHGKKYVFSCGAWHVAEIFRWTKISPRLGQLPLHYRSITNVVKVAIQICMQSNLWDKNFTNESSWQNWIFWIFSWPVKISGYTCIVQYTCIHVYIHATICIHIYIIYVVCIISQIIELLMYMGLEMDKFVRRSSKYLPTIHWCGNRPEGTKNTSKFTKNGENG